MEKTGRIMLTSEEANSFRSTGEIPKRIRESWGITDPAELWEHINSGFAEVVNNKSDNNGDSK